MDIFVNVVRARKFEISPRPDNIPPLSRVLQRVPRQNVHVGTVGLGPATVPSGPKGAVETNT